MHAQASIPSSATATLLLAARTSTTWLAVTNHGDANVFYGFDGDAGVTTSAGAKAGIVLKPQQTHLWTTRGEASQSYIGPVYVVQQSGTAQLVSVQWLP